jgi:hypothetical protein
MPVRHTREEGPRERQAVWLSDAERVAFRAEARRRGHRSIGSWLRALAADAVLKARRKA